MDNQPERQIRERRRLLQNPYAFLGPDGEYDAVPRIQVAVPHIQIDRRRTRNDIEPIVRDFLQNMWRDRTYLFPEHNSLRPHEILDPLVALNYIGYSTEIVESLGRHTSNGEHFEVAGTIDSSEQKVQISRRFPLATRNFTAAHELGHAILHDGVGLHRDRPLNGTPTGYFRDNIEREADTFATLFLMPENLVRGAFRLRFGVTQFVINEGTAFALNKGNVDQLRAECPQIRDLSKLLAGAEQYDQTRFSPLYKQFNVSIEAMAIRLEELRLIQL